MIFQNKPFHQFESEDEKKELLIRYNLLSPNPKKEKVFMYRGRDVTIPTPCEIVGYESQYEDWATIVIDYGQGPCFIHSMFLKDMQSSRFKLDDPDAD